MSELELNAQDLIERFGLVPLPGEGGLYCQTYRSAIELEAGESLGTGSASRPLATAILYLLTPGGDGFSALHRLSADEVYHFYLGDPVEMLLLGRAFGARQVTLGHDLLHGEEVQFLVPGGVWQGCRLREGGRFALMGTTMAPGFDPADFELGLRRELTSLYPEATDEILRLTRS